MPTQLTLPANQATSYQNILDDGITIVLQDRSVLRNSRFYAERIRIVFSRQAIVAQNIFIGELTMETEFTDAAENRQFLENYCLGGATFHSHVLCRYNVVNGRAQDRPEGYMTIVGNTCYNASATGVYIGADFAGHAFAGNVLGGEPTPKITEEAKETAWLLLKDYMTKEQYKAFEEGQMIEVENSAKTHRLLLKRDGTFMALDGQRGEGFIIKDGRIKERRYPIGDEIAAFLDWFKYKTEELVQKWKCGKFSIIKEGEVI